MKKLLFLLLAVSMFNVYCVEADKIKEEKRVPFYIHKSRFPGVICRNIEGKDGKLHKLCVDEF